jgi:hypothetical protein
LWGLAHNVIEEPGSPCLLGSDGQGLHANKNNNQSKHHNSHKRGQGNKSNKQMTNKQGLKETKEVLISS